jgi:hypothetical protein
MNKEYVEDLVVLDNSETRRDASAEAGPKSKPCSKEVLLRVLRRPMLRRRLKGCNRE